MTLLNSYSFFIWLVHNIQTLFVVLHTCSPGMLLASAQVATKCKSQTHKYDNTIQYSHVSNI